jgi:hypothetical protein
MCLGSYNFSSVEGAVGWEGHTDNFDTIHSLNCITFFKPLEMLGIGVPCSFILVVQKWRMFENR